MAIIPVVYIQSLEIDYWTVDFYWTTSDTKYTLILAAILIPLGIFNAKGKAHLTMYPQVRMKKWNSFEYISNIASWGVYLLGYEFLFRGIFFLGLIPFTGLYPAIAINTVLYALAHLYKGKKETLGSIPLGIVLCLITAQTQTIWTAFAVHWIMAVNNFVWSQYYQLRSSN
jgi:membrane protease YdiL (CAAX protease family)